MGRPSKLTEKEWEAILKRVPPLGTESMRSVAKEKGISEGSIRLRINAHVKPITTLANQIATVEQKFEALPINTQVKVRTLADKLKGISDHMASAAEYGAQTAHRLKMIAHTKAQNIDDVSPSEDDLKMVNGLVRVANESAHIGLNLLAANKGQLPADPNDPEAKPRSRADFYGQQADS